MRFDIAIFFAWFDFWIGFYYDRKNAVLYICLVPTVVVRIKIIEIFQIIGFHTRTVIGYTFGRETFADVLAEEPGATFRRISRRQYDREQAEEL